MTFASFTSSDAFYYWETVLGLTVDPGRITVVNVDGGSGPPSDASGSDETTLDVEQSGGIAPGANVIVYEAPNTNQGSVDIYAAAVETNLAQSISISWGFWEWYQNLENSPVTDPITGKTVGITQPSKGSRFSLRRVTVARMMRIAISVTATPQTAPCRSLSTIQAAIPQSLPGAAPRSPASRNTARMRLAPRPFSTSTLRKRAFGAGTISLTFARRSSAPILFSAGSSPEARAEA